MADLRRRPRRETTKRAVPERFAVAEAQQAAKEMFSATVHPCPLGLDLARQATIRYGRASARLADTHSEIRAAYSSMSKDYDRLLARCLRR